MYLFKCFNSNYFIQKNYFTTNSLSLVALLQFAPAMMLFCTDACFVSANSLFVTILVLQWCSFCDAATVARMLLYWLCFFSPMLLLQQQCLASDNGAVLPTMLLCFDHAADVKMLVSNDAAVATMLCLQWCYMLCFLWLVLRQCLFATMPVLRRCSLVSKNAAVATFLCFRPCFGCNDV